MRKQRIIIKAPTNLGLKEPAPGVEPGVKYFPEKLLEQSFAKRINSVNLEEVIPSSYESIIDPESKVRNADLVRDYSVKLSSKVNKYITGEYFTVVIGGDCSVLIGNTIALKKAGKYGLFFIDGHTDFCLPEHNLSTSAAGMELAIVTGYGHDKLTNISGLKPYVEEDNVFCYASRDYDERVEKIIKQSHINYLNLKDIRDTEIKRIINDFLLMVERKNLDGFWIHLDVDVLNDDIMPCVDSRETDGLSYDEIKQTLIPLLSSDKAAGIEFTIFDPTLDPDGKYLKEFSDHMVEIFAAAG